MTDSVPVPTPDTAALTSDEREAVETRGAAGGTAAYIRRLTDGHWFTFYSRDDGSLGVGVCTCGEPGCHRPSVALRCADLTDSRDREAAKFQAETRTTSFLAERLRSTGPACDRCERRDGSQVVVDGEQREWVCSICLSTEAKNAT